MSSKTKRLIAEIRDLLAGPDRAQLDEDIARAERIATRALELVAQGESFVVESRTGTIRFRDGRCERVAP